MPNYLVLGIEENNCKIIIILKFLMESISKFAKEFKSVICYKILKALINNSSSFLL